MKLGIFKEIISTIRKWVPNKKLYFLAMLFSILAKIIWLLVPYFIGQMINVVQIWWWEMWNDLLPWIIMLIVTPFVARWFHGPARVREQHQQYLAIKIYKETLYHMMMKLSINWHSDHHSGDTIDRINKSANALQKLMDELHMYLYTVVFFLWSLLMIVILRWYMILPLLITLVISFFVISYFDKIIVSLSQERNTIQHKSSALLFDFLSNIRTIITLKAENTTKIVYDEALKKELPIANKRAIYNETKRFLIDVIVNLSVIIGLVGYIWYQWKYMWMIMIWGITIMLWYLQNIRGMVDNITWFYSQIVEAEIDLKSANIIIDAYNSLPSSSLLSWLWNWNKIAIRNLTFHYKEKRNILSDVSLSMKRWEKIAFVGESGSGKSTFLSLLRGLYDVEKVKVNIDGKIYDTLDPLYNDTSLIPQEPEIFEETIAFNISMGLDLPQDTLEKYAKIARFHDIAIWLPHSYDTNIKEKWVNLSGWQKQRLALARGLLVAEDSSIVLLDESTSSVDSINEKKIYTSIFEEFQEKTIIAAIHKIHLLNMFDMIYVFDGGKIVESGWFDDLLAQWWVLAKMREEYQTTHKKRK